MNQPNPSQPEESQQIACAEEAVVDKLRSEQLRKFLRDHRNRLRVERAALLGAADRMKDDIAALDLLLADLTT